VLAAVDAVRQAVDEVNGLIRGRLVVGMVTACTVTPLFDALAAFHIAHPGVDITLIEDNSDRLIERVRSGTVDVALVGASGTAPAGLAALPIVSERLVAAVPFDHPLGERQRTTLAEISRYPIVCMPEGTGVRAVFDEACAANGIRVDIALQASAPGTVADLAQRGLGIAILSESMAATHSARLKALVIDDVDTLACSPSSGRRCQAPRSKDCCPTASGPLPAPGTPRSGGPSPRDVTTTRNRLATWETHGRRGMTSRCHGALPSRRPGPLGAKGPWRSAPSSPMERRLWRAATIRCSIPDPVRFRPRTWPMPK
jgi:DNA-binding transcriptional LysR family regulator